MLFSAAIGKIKVLYDSAVLVQKLLGEVGLCLLDAANKSEWHNITRARPGALAAQARAASGFKFLNSPRTSRLPPNLAP